MAEIRFHLDEQLPRALARALRAAGIDLETTPEANLLGASDLEHLSHAHVHGRVVVTEDEDYSRLHRAGHPHSGIAFFPNGPRPIGEVVELLTLLHEAYDAEEMVGRLEWL